jgi:hypothetical protein
MVNGLLKINEGTWRNILKRKKVQKNSEKLRKVQNRQKFRMANFPSFNNQCATKH